MKNLFYGVLLGIGLPALAHQHGHPGGGHLTFSNGAVHAHASWVQGPAVGRESVLKLEWRDGATHQPTAAPGAFEVEPYMTQHGHGTSENRIVQAVDEKGAPILGSYLVQEIFFSMPCAWDIRVHVTYPNGVRETQFFTENVDAKNCGHDGHGHGRHRH